MSTKNKTKSSPKKSLPVLQFTENPVIILSDKICSQINYLHRKVERTEWSGILLYSHKEGDISNPDELVIVAEELYLMDIGTSAYTEYTNDVDSILDLFDKYPKLESAEWKMGHIHTHHGLGSTSFSGTDMQELQDNAPNHNYYLSLIVDFKCKPTAKIATVCELAPRTVSHPGASDKVQKTLMGEERLGIYECTVTHDLDQNFSDRFSLIKKQKEEEKKRKAAQKKQRWGNPNYNNGRSGYSDIPQNYHGLGWGMNVVPGDDDEMQRDLFVDPDFSEKSISSFIYKWLNFNLAGPSGTVDEAIDQIDIWIGDANGDTIGQYAQQLMDGFEDYAVDIIGDGYLLTNDEYLKLIKICIDLLEPHESNNLIKRLLDELQQYQELVEEELEV